MTPATFTPIAPRVHPDRYLIIIPAFNEAAAIPELLRELREACPRSDVLVISDGSVDSTAVVARQGGARVLDLPCNLGVGGAVQAGFQYAAQQGYDGVVRIDGDGQHRPSEIEKLFDRARNGPEDLIVGTRFGGGEERVSSRLRHAGIRVLARFLSIICRSRVTDPTSGFWLVRRPLLDCFAQSYPSEYPEPEALALLRRQGYLFTETPVQFRRRTAGRSSIRKWDTVYFALKVGLALVVDRIRPVDRALSREQMIRRTTT